MPSTLTYLDRARNIRVLAGLCFCTQIESAADRAFGAQRQGPRAFFGVKEPFGPLWGWGGASRRLRGILSHFGAGVKDFQSFKFGVRGFVARDRCLSARALRLRRLTLLGAWPNEVGSNWSHFVIAILLNWPHFVLATTTLTQKTEVCNIVSNFNLGSTLSGLGSEVSALGFEVCRRCSEA